MYCRRHLSRARVGGLLFVLSVLTACTPASMVMTGPPEDIWNARRQRLHQLQQWELKGRIGFVSKNDSGSASLYWKQDHDVYELKIVAPFGMGSLSVSGNENGVTLQSSDGEMLFAEDAQSLVWQKTGWVIPMASLRYWILGLPHADESYKLDRFGRIQNIQSQSWQVEYQAYRRIDQHELPRKLRLFGPDVRIKLLIKDWRLND